MEAAVLSVELTYFTNFKEDDALVDQIYELTKPSYISNLSLIEREIKHNKDIYVIRSVETGELFAFFMVNYELLNDEPSCYLGLSACRNEFKGHGYVKQLYQRFMEDCRKKEKQQGQKILLWWTTATPVVYYWFNKHAQDVQPDMDGGYDIPGKEIVEQIKAEKFSAVHSDEQHPFILRSVAAETQYSDEEKERLALATQHLQLDVFQKYNVVEENGDRFLMIGYVPD